MFNKRNKGDDIVDQSSIISIAEKYADLAKQILPVKSIYLFGSYAKGTADSDSDIDIAVIVDKVEGDYLEPRVKLVELTHLVDLRIEPILLEEARNKSGFIQTVMKSGQLIYPKLQQ